MFRIGLDNTLIKGNRVTRINVIDEYKIVDSVEYQLETAKRKGAPTRCKRNKKYTVL